MNDSLKNITGYQYNINDLTTKVVPDLKKYKMMNLKRDKSNRLINLAYDADILETEDTVITINGDNYSVYKTNDNLKSLAYYIPLNDIGVLCKHNQTKYGIESTLKDCISSINVDI